MNIYRRKPLRNALCLRNVHVYIFVYSQICIHICTHVLYIYKHAEHKNDTELSKEFWEIRKRSGTPKITRKIIRICRSYNPNSKRCFFCLNEKYEIADTEASTNLLTIIL